MRFLGQRGSHSTQGCLIEAERGKTQRIRARCTTVQEGCGRRALLLARRGAGGGRFPHARRGEAAGDPSPARDFATRLLARPPAQRSRPHCQLPQRPSPNHSAQLLPHPIDCRAPLPSTAFRARAASLAPVGLAATAGRSKPFFKRKRLPAVGRRGGEIACGAKEA